MNRATHFILVLTVLTLLTGCWDRTEINDMAFVVATGVDKRKNEYSVTVQVPLPSSLGGAGSSGGGGGTSGEGPYYIAQGTGGNLRRGLEDIQSRLSRRLYFGHRRVIIIGEEMAKDGISEVLSAVFTQPQSRVSTFLLISKGEAVKLLESQPRMEQYSGEAIREMAKSSLNRTVLDALQNMNRPGIDTVVPVIEATGTIKEDKNGKEVSMTDFAVFKKDKLAFTTKQKESRAVLWLEQKMRKKTFPFETIKNKEISVQVIENTVNPSFQEVNGKPEFTLSVRVTAVLFENEPNLKIEDPKTYHFIIGKMEKAIKEEIKALLDHAHSEGADVYGFGWYLYRTHHQEWQDRWEKNWEQTLKEMKVTVKVNGDIQRTTNTGSIEKE
nr:Ger(x)C family spore germination protein [Neobacillus sp. Marseille-Q6967]